MAAVTAPPGGLCRRKRAYDTQKWAERVLAGMVRRGSYAATLNAYQCKRCGSWHIGHQPGARRRAS